MKLLFILIGLPVLNTQAAKEIKRLKEIFNICAQIILLLASFKEVFMAATLRRLYSRLYFHHGISVFCILMCRLDFFDFFFKILDKCFLGEYFEGKKSSMHSRLRFLRQTDIVTLFNIST